MEQRRSPKEIIESVKNPWFEESWTKLPRKEPTPASIKRELNRVIYSNYRVLDKHLNIHTHPSFESPNLLSFYPSSQDFLGFLSDSNEKGMVIAQTNSSNGRLHGYFFVRKTKKTKEDHFNLTELVCFLIENSLNKLTFGLYKGYGIGMNLSHADKMEDSTERIEKLEKFMQKYHLQYRHVPVVNSREVTE